MSNLTPNLGLKQPLGTESADIAIINENMGIIDANTAKKQQEQWITPTLLNGWVNFGGENSPVGYYKDEFGSVHPSGVIKGGIVAEGTVILTFPAAYRPASIKTYIVATQTGTAESSGKLVLNPDGTLAVGPNIGNGYVALDCIPPFRAEQ